MAISSNSKPIKRVDLGKLRALKAEFNPEEGAVNLYFKDIEQSIGYTITISYIDVGILVGSCAKAVIEAEKAFKDGTQ